MFILFYNIVDNFLIFVYFILIIYFIVFIL